MPSVSSKHAPHFLIENNVQLMKIGKCNILSTCVNLFITSAVKTLTCKYPLVDFPLIEMSSKVELILETRFWVMRQKKTKLGFDACEF